MKKLIVAIVMTMALLVPNTVITDAAVADERTPGCVTNKEWKKTPIAADRKAVAKLYGTKGIRNEKRSHDGIVVKFYPICGYESMDPNNPIDCKSGRVLVKFDFNRGFIPFTYYETNHDNYSCPEGSHYNVV